jgi:hypothetical protein
MLIKDIFVGSEIPGLRFSKLNKNNRKIKKVCYVLVLFQKIECTLYTLFHSEIRGCFFVGNPLNCMVCNLSLFILLYAVYLPLSHLLNGMFSKNPNNTFYSSDILY